MTKQSLNARLFAALLTGAAASLSLSGCMTSPPMSMAQPDLTFAQYQGIPVNVAKVEVFNQYTPPMDGRHVESEFQTPPATAAENLAKAKLLATGTANILRVYIDEASVVMQKLPKDTGFMSTFVRQPSERYAARVALRFELVDATAPDIVIGRANISSDRTTTILENTSLADRDQAYLDLTEALMKDIYDGFVSTVQPNFGVPR